MTTQPSDLYELLHKIRYDCTAIQAKITDALAILSALNLPTTDTPTCPICGVQIAGPNRLAEHTTNVHGDKP